MTVEEYSKGYEECTLCDGRGEMTNEYYETGDCPSCDGSGFRLAVESAKEESE
ncbi:hypothetical protein 8F11_38 [uncultured Caudovirales phage]|uniref:Uncharacterized protein n=1 Tax=uncultured Caudovirales phage TaxID=2100421 RepID=A0A2H4J2K6_9CAUD|nr:hypothetical protein 8F11_38 [uncultured Caudovirales phage]